MTWIDTLRCVSCGGTLSREQEVMRCTLCSSSYPFLHDTPILVEGTTVARKATPPESDALLALIPVLGVTEAQRPELSACFSLDFRFTDPILQTESEQFLSRLRSSGATIPEPYPLAATNVMRAALAQIDNVAAAVTLDVLTWPSSVPPGESFAVTVMIRNEGSTTLSSASENAPLNLSYQWSHGEVPHERTQLLIDLPPGHQISMPVRITAPLLAGDATLSILPVVEGVRWMDQVAVHKRIAVDAGASLDPQWTVTADARDYGQDHMFAIKLLQGWIDDRKLDRPVRVLEVGGNLHPMIALLEGDVELYNVDIDPFGLMACSIRNTVDGGRVRNVVADGTQTPFGHDFFDVIVMFATFHHFPDPRLLLTALHRQLRLDGFLAVLCEPVGHVFAPYVDPDFLNELQRGVYEQSFMAWEYRDMLEDTGFEIVSARVDISSLKLQARIGR